MSGDKTNHLDRLVKLLDGLTDANHGEDCKAYGHGPDSDAEDKDEEIDDNPLDFLEHCDCGLKDAFEAWKIAKSLAALTLSPPGLPPAGLREAVARKLLWMFQDQRVFPAGRWEDYDEATQAQMLQYADRLRSVGGAL